MYLSIYFTTICLVPCAKQIHRWEKGYYKILIEQHGSWEGTPNLDSYTGGKKNTLKWVLRNNRFLSSTHTY